MEMILTVWKGIRITDKIPTLTTIIITEIITIRTIIEIIIMETITMIKEAIETKITTIVLQFHNANHNKWLNSLLNVTEIVHNQLRIMKDLKTIKDHKIRIIQEKNNQEVKTKIKEKDQETTKLSHLIKNEEIIMKLSN